MEVTRRGFLQLAGAAFATTTMYDLLGPDSALALPKTDSAWKLVDTRETATICCYCSGGCGTIVSVRGDDLINIEGDPDHPINRGGLCSKGSSQFAVRSVIDPETDDRRLNPFRLTKPMVRRPGSDIWEELTWEMAIEGIAKHIKKTRDENYETVVDGVTVNRCEALSSFGGSALDNEEGYALQKMMRGLGATHIEHQARI